MRKKIITLLMVTAVAISCAWATPWIQLGGIVDYGKSVSEEDFAEGFKAISNYGFGAEARFNLFSWVSIDIPATFRFGDDFTISTRPSLNLNIPALSFLDIALGLGTNLAFTSGDDGWTMNGMQFSDGLDALMNSSLFYRGAVTFNLAVVSIGLSAEVPMEGTFNSFGMAPVWDFTRVSASVLFNLL